LTLIDSDTYIVYTLKRLAINVTQNFKLENNIW